MLLITADERTLLFYKDNESARVKGEKQTAEERGVRQRGDDVTDQQNTESPSATTDRQLM